MRAERTGDLTFTGVFDLTKSLTEARYFSANLADSAKAMPFDLTLDSQCRPVRVDIHVPLIDRAPPGLTYTFGDFGTTIAVAVPPEAEVREALDILYLMLGN